jgi:hypothetical protein
MILTLQELKGTKRTKQRSIRLPVDLCEQAEKLAKTLSVDGKRVKESDIYRNAILIYFAEKYTISTQIDDRIPENGEVQS